MSKDDLLAKAKAGDPQAAFQYGLHCIKIGHTDIGKQWLDFAIKRGSIDASLELAVILNKEGDPAAARSALSVASQALHPKALFVAGLTYFSEGDYELASSLFSAAHDQGVEEAATMKDAVWVMRTAQEVENRQIQKVQKQAEALLDGNRPMEGSIPLRPHWWAHWWPDLDSQASIAESMNDYVEDLNWQLTHFIKNLAFKHDVAYWNEFASTSDSEIIAVEKILADPIILQRAVGFVAANEVAEILYWRQEIQRSYAQVSERTNDQKVTSALPLFVQAYKRMNPEAMSRVISLLPYYLWMQARELKETLELEAALSTKDLTGKITSIEESALFNARDVLYSSGDLSLSSFERTVSFFEYCPEAFPLEPHMHLQGGWPRRGWVKYLGSNNASLNPPYPEFSGCTLNFRNGGWRCEERQEVSDAMRAEAAEFSRRPLPAAIQPIRPVKKATPAAKKAVPVAKKAVPVAKKAVPVAKKAVPVAKRAVPVAKRAVPANPQKPVSSAVNPQRPYMCLLIDEIMDEGDFVLPVAPQGWTSRRFDVGPVPGELAVNGHFLHFTFEIGKFSGKTRSMNLAEIIARSVAGQGISFSATLQPQPQVTMKISIPSDEDVSTQMIAMTFMQVADAVMQVFQAAVKIGEMIDPSKEEIEKFGLAEPRLMRRGPGSRNWGKQNLGAAFILGEA